MTGKLVREIDRIGGEYRFERENGIVIEIPYSFRVGFMEKLTDDFRIDESRIYRIRLDAFGNASLMLVILGDD